MTLSHFLCKLNAKIVPPKLLPVAACLNFSPIFYSSTLSKNCSRKHIENEVSGTLVSKRRFWETFPDTRRYTLFEKDRVSRKNYELVYRSKMFSYTFFSQLASEIVASVQVSYLTYVVISHLLGYPVSFGQFSPVPVIFDGIGCAVFCAFSIQNFIVFALAQRIPLRMYYSEEDDEYVLIFLGINPFVTRQIRCKPGGIEMLNSDSIISRLFGSYRLVEKGKRISLNSSFFKETYYYNHLLGFLK